MTKHIFYLLAITICSGCSVVSKQYYYVPNVAHNTVKDKSGYFKMIHSKVELAGNAGASPGSITTSNGVGAPLLMGPPYVPVVPVALVDVFYKQDKQFQMDISVNTNDGYFMRLAIDSASYKIKRDSLNRLGTMTAARLNTRDCYMIVNGSKKVPLQAKEFFMGSSAGHSYQLRAPIGFAKVRTVTIVTGNTLLDSTLKNITFKRRKRLTYCVLGLS